MRAMGKNGLTELRDLYANQQVIDGRSKLSDTLPDLMNAAKQDWDARADADRKAMALRVADFPLLETHYAAQTYSEALSPSDEDAMAFHVVAFQVPSDGILASKKDWQDGSV